MYCIILCGGSGTRLWPLSRKNFPKQFLKLYSDKSLLQETFLRMKEVVPQENIYFVTNEENQYNVLNQIKEVYEDFKESRVIREPKSLDTMPAITLAVKYLQEIIKIDEMAPIIEVHSDHYIGDKENYVKIAKNALSKVKNNLGAIGIIPTMAHTGLGYIKKGEKIDDYFKVEAFKEKPDKKTAQEFVDSGQYLWNAGMYLFNTKTFSEELERYVPEIYSAFSKSYEDFCANFSDLPSVAIDVALSEKSDRMVVFEGEFGWSDIGSFDVLAEILSQKKDSNPKHLSIDCKNVFVHSVNNGLVVTSGVEDIIIIENNDSILVQKMGESNDGVKKVVEYLKEKKMPELSDSIIVYRPWGKYEVLIDKLGYKVKKITVNPESRLSLQSHRKRTENWIVVKGNARVFNGGSVADIKEGEGVFIPIGSKHRLENMGKEILEIIEVQTGSYLEEDDIVHYEDDYNRE
ncbi:MAG: mannose-1-phosphate guanylyltransferase/mannose-6-phosphate isomerase [Parcubacteria group bacterium]|jgi:mannose-1-phosphate guanylyltransferase/mannose-6-phosphate isomerase